MMDLRQFAIVCAAYIGYGMSWVFRAFLDRDQTEMAIGLMVVGLGVYLWNTRGPGAF